VIVTIPPPKRLVIVATRSYVPALLTDWAGIVPVRMLSRALRSREPGMRGPSRARGDSKKREIANCKLRIANCKLRRGCRFANLHFAILNLQFAIPSLSTRGETSGTELDGISGKVAGRVGDGPDAINGSFHLSDEHRRKRRVPARVRMDSVI